MNDSDVVTVVSNTIHMLVATGIFLAGAALTAINSALQDAPVDWVLKNILGPTGTLVGAIAAIWFLVRYMRKMQDKLYLEIQERLEDKDRQIERLQRLNESLQKIIDGRN